MIEKKSSVHSLGYLDELNARTRQKVFSSKVFSASQTLSGCIAFIGSEDLQDSLAAEVELLRIRIENYAFFLEAKLPDLLIVESCYEASTPCWSYSQSSSSDKYPALLAVLHLCRQLSIPTVFWDTLGYEGFDYFRGITKEFDYVFYADTRSAQLYSLIGIAATYLPLGVQVRRFNPFGSIETRAESGRARFLYDGFAAVHRHPELFAWMRSPAFSELGLIDSCDRVFESKIGELHISDAQVIGSVSSRSRSELLKSALAEIYVPNPSQSPGTIRRRALEAAAAKAIPLYAGRVPIQGFGGGELMECGSDLGLLTAAQGLLDMSGPELGVLKNHYWREVNQHHSIAKRLQEIYSVVGLPWDWVEYPLVTILVSTFRLERILSVIESLDMQSYPNKEVVIVINSNAGVPDFCVELERARPDIRFFAVPRDRYTGHCLKLGFSVARGDLVLKVDDDDFYGRHYVTDMVLAQRAVDADIFGKPPCYVCFEGDDALYARKRGLNEDVVFEASQLAPGSLWLGGNSLAGKTGFLRRLDFDERCYGAADTALILAAKSKLAKVCLHDLSSLAAMRSADEREHTWRLSEQSFKSTCVNVGIESAVAQALWRESDVHPDPFTRARLRPLEERVFMALASIPEREAQLHRTLLSVIGQVDRVCVYLNGYERVPDFLHHPKIEYFRSQDYEDLGAAGKFYAIDRIQDGYYFTIDDDIIYPSNYVDKIIACLKKYNDSVAACVHGSIFASPLEWYFERTEVLGLKKGLRSDKFVTLVGTGCLAFHRKRIELSFSDFYPKVMCDLTFSVKARDQGVPLVSIARPANWLVPQEQISNNTYYDRMLIDDGGRTELACRYDWSFHKYRELIKAWALKEFSGFKAADFKKKGMDVEVLAALSGRTVPKLWDAQRSVAYHRRRLQKLIIDKALAEAGSIEDAKLLLPEEGDIGVLREKIKKFTRVDGNEY